MRARTKQVKPKWWVRLEKLYPSQKKLADVLGHVATTKEIEKDKTQKEHKIVWKKVAGELRRWKPMSDRMIRYLKTGKRRASKETLERAHTKKEQIETYYFRLAEREDISVREAKKRVKEWWKKEKQWLGVYS